MQSILVVTAVGLAFRSSALDPGGEKADIAGNQKRDGLGTVTFPVGVLSWYLSCSLLLGLMLALFGREKVGPNTE